MTPTSAPPRPAGHDAPYHGGMLLLALIWGVNFPVIKAALVEVPPLAFNALRFPLAAGVLAVLLVGTRRGRSLGVPRPGDRASVVALGLLGNVAYQLLFIFGVARTSAGNASLLLSTTPVWTVGLSVAIGAERPPLAVWAGAIATVGGMVLVVLGGPGLALGPHTLVGDGLMIASSMVWAGYTVGSRPLVARYGAMPVTAWTLWAGTPVLVLLGLPALAGGAAAALSPATWGAVIYAGTLAISVAYLLWNVGLRQLGSTRTAVYSNLVPVVALATAWVALGERPGTLQLGGAAVILGGLTLTRVRRGPGLRPRPNPAPSGAAPRGTRTGESPHG